KLTLTLSCQKNVEGEKRPSPFLLEMASMKINRTYQLLKFSFHGSAKSADPFQSDLPLTLISKYHPVQKGQATGLYIQTPEGKQRVCIYKRLRASNGFVYTNA
ncbi:hypothetical protein LGW52_10255, partial [Streptococcus mutans]|nr:hypothetical protein [Streptococcus mutans]